MMMRCKMWTGSALSLALALLFSLAILAVACTASQAILRSDNSDNSTTTSSSSARTRPWSSSPRFAVDYYPAQWHASLWQADAQLMLRSNITHVRISEFDWAMLEPSEGVYDWTLLDASLHVLHAHGLKVILGTPTATPPAWVVRRYEVLPRDAYLRERHFGSRRHYSFSSQHYRRLSSNITRALAKRYGMHPAVDAWQLDNELGCHNTVRTYDLHATLAFRHWLALKYSDDIAVLNEAQGRAFWSEAYESFEEVRAPSLTVTEDNPALRMDWLRFSSEQVAEFASEQVEVIRRYSDREQMHAGMMRPDNVPDAAWHEQQAAARDVRAMERVGVLSRRDGHAAAAAEEEQHELRWTLNRTTPKVALVLDYTAAMLLEVNPQGGRWDTNTFKDYAFQYPELLTEWYSALRRLALDVDVIGPDTSLAHYTLVLVPTMPIISSEFDRHLANYNGTAVFGPRTASKTSNVSIPHGLAPSSGALRDRMPLKVVRVESLREGLDDSVSLQGATYAVDTWSEWLECERDNVRASEPSPVLYHTYRAGEAASCEHITSDAKHTIYLGYYARSNSLIPLFASLAARLRIKNVLNRLPSASEDLGEYVRLTRYADTLFAFNYDDKRAREVRGVPSDAVSIFGQEEQEDHLIGPAGVRAWKMS
ncbi:beta-galactosidase [Ceraceosorus bombacis]|uniref:beta-galactosidase n=1 Tax=Ceraceosorus bombacis TaxID=401625 RepID=A0A0P1BBA3_9BASI|nr:beta-galactosidase [Ceraceosorus bombacis]